MPSIYDIKPKFQNLLRPLTKKLATNGITANQVTLAALVLSLLTGIALIFSGKQTGIYLLVPLVLFVRMALNAIDGMLAREHDMKSPLGAILNELCDVISDVALYLPFALLPEISLWIIVLLVIAAIISEMTGVIAIQIGASRRYDGPMGKSDRAFVFGALALALGLGMPSGSWLNELFGFVLLLTLATIYNRARQALTEIQA
ncbi:CDP-alcohol phosphatidyltransferase family protein [Methyloglobulus sp.]|uniref:CDP-alcohol phosphatidyltransferase family protein n=1 Tax=Methyloglobulus sp. TaxID=2518622 RepID=UPI0032B81F1D